MSVHLSSIIAHVTDLADIHVQTDGGTQLVFGHPRDKFRVVVFLPDHGVPEHLRRLAAEIGAAQS